MRLRLPATTHTLMGVRRPARTVRVRRFFHHQHVPLLTLSVHRLCHCQNPPMFRTIFAAKFGKCTKNKKIQVPHELEFILYEL